MSWTVCVISEPPTHSIPKHPLLSGPFLLHCIPLALKTSDLLHPAPYPHSLVSSLLSKTNPSYQHPHFMTPSSPTRTHNTTHDCLFSGPVPADFSPSNLFFSFQLFTSCLADSHRHPFIHFLFNNSLTQSPLLFIPFPLENPYFSMYPVFSTLPIEPIPFLLLNPSLLSHTTLPRSYP